MALVVRLLAGAVVWRAPVRLVVCLSGDRVVLGPAVWCMFDSGRVVLGPAVTLVVRLPGDRVMLGPDVALFVSL